MRRTKRTMMRNLLLSASLSVLILSPPAAAADEKEPQPIFDVQPSEQGSDGYDVVIRGQTALQLTGELGGLTADERARIIADRFVKYFANGGTVQDIRPAMKDGHVVIVGSKEQILATLPDEDVTVDGKTLPPKDAALALANKIRGLLGAQPLQTNPLDELQEKAEPSASPVLASYQGKTTWYGKEFRGNSTASGEIFDERKLTAAHREWPFGTTVRVTSLTTGKSVVVRVNDRGPWKAGYDLDLSWAAAQAIGIVSKGVDRVKLEVLQWGARP